LPPSALITTPYVIAEVRAATQFSPSSTSVLKKPSYRPRQLGYVENLFNCKPFSWKLLDLQADARSMLISSRRYYMAKLSDWDLSR